MGVLGGLLGSFAAGALVGAFAFAHVGYVFTVPIALLLLALAAVPLLDDLRRLRGGGAGRASARPGSRIGSVAAAAACVVPRLPA